MSKLPDALGRDGYEVIEESRFERYPDAKHHRCCPCAECRLEREKAEGVHRQVYGGRPYGINAACGLHVPSEMSGLISSPRFANEGEAVTCPACLAKK